MRARGRLGSLGQGQQALPAGMVKMPQVAPYYVRSKREPSAVPPNDEMISGRVSKERIEAQYGLDYLKRKKLIKGYTYTLDGAQPFVLAAGAEATGTITINKEADFELHKLACLVDVPALGIVAGRGDDFTFRVRDERTGIFLTSGFIHNICGTGSGIFPLVLPDTHLVKRSNMLSFIMQNRRATALNVWWNLDGKNYFNRDVENLTDIPSFERLSRQQKQFFLAKQKKYITPYIYTMDTTPVVLGVGGTLVDQPMTIRQEHDFEIFAWTAFSTAGPFTWHARESNTGRFLSNRPLLSAGSMGDGERPHILPEPYFLDANSELLITFVNQNAAVGNTVFIAFIGRAWFDTASLNLTIGPEFYLQKYGAF